MAEPLLQIKNLQKKYPIYGPLGKMFPPVNHMRAVADVSLNEYGDLALTPVLEGYGIFDGVTIFIRESECTGYTVYVYEHPGNIVLKTIKVDKSTQHCELIDELDQDLYEKRWTSDDFYVNICRPSESLVF